MEDQTLKFQLFGISFDGTICFMTLLVCALIYGLVFYFSRKMEIRPTKRQNALEWLVDFVRNIVADNVPESEIGNYHFLAFILFTFTFMANQIGLITKIVYGPENFSIWKSPTADPLVTLTMALIVILLSHFYGLRKLGAKKYFVNSYLRPLPFLLPVNFVEEFTNLLTLGLRLYGNIFAGEILLSLIAQLAMNNAFTFVIAVPLEMIWVAFSVFIGAIQAFVFTTLTLVYISHKIEEEH